MHADCGPKNAVTVPWPIGGYRPIGVTVGAIFGPPFVKRFALCYQTVVCLSVCLVLSLTLVCCSQTVAWIKMKLGLRVDLGPGHIALDGNPAPPPKGAHLPVFGPYLLWPNGNQMVLYFLTSRKCLCTT